LRRIAHRGGYAFQTGDRVLDDRQQTVKKQRDNRRPRAEAERRDASASTAAGGKVCPIVASALTIGGNRARPAGDEDREADAEQRRGKARQRDQPGMRQPQIDKAVTRKDRRSDLRKR